ncbi:MAG: glycosyltransferase [Cucumibacter sp.]
MPKRIAMASIGTQGDVQPYVALGVALRKRGHEVVMGAPDDFGHLAESYGLEFHSLGRNIQEFLKETQFENAMSQNMLVNAPALLREGQRIVDTAARASWVMAQGADALVLNQNTSYGVDIAEALGIPAVMAAMQPLNSTSEFPFCAYYGPSFGKAFNKLSYTAMGVSQIYYNLPRNRLRRELMGLKTRRIGGLFRDNEGNRLPTLCAYSEHVSRRPKDWPATSVVTGYWQLADNTGWEPSKRFRKWLAEGDKPIYVGFGSMPFGAPRNTEILKEAVAQWGGRVVVARGWGGINPDDLPASIYAIGRAPHDKLFGYVKAVVHHGGAGTTASGLHAGRPSFVVPQTVDQPYWGKRIYDLGCGPKPVRLRRLTAESLAEALHLLDTTTAYEANAMEIAEKLSAENGTARAVEAIEQIMEGRTFRRPARRKVAVTGWFGERSA